MTVGSVDIAICTWNRADLLRQSLDSLCRVRVPDEFQWRVIVIDNNSNDSTGVILDSYRDRLPLVTAVEMKQGHTHARNLAVQKSEADLVLWTDDDVVVSPDWLMNFVRVANEFPEAVFFGGAIRPLFIGGQPDWIDANWNTLRGCFAERDLGTSAIELDESQLPYGANFAVRGDVQRENLFHTSLGRRGNAYVGEDELELLRRLCSQGLTGRWVPDSPVDHMISPERSTTKYVYDYFVGQGRMLAAKGNPWTKSRVRLWIQEFWNRFMYQLKRGVAGSPVWLGHLARAGLARGQRLQLGGQ